MITIKKQELMVETTKLMVQIKSQLDSLE